MAATTTKQTALDAFMTAKADIDALLADLAAKSADHFAANPDRIHWGDVGSLGEVAMHLRRALENA